MKKCEHTSATSRATIREIFTVSAFLLSNHVLVYIIKNYIIEKFLCFWFTRFSCLSKSLTIHNTRCVTCTYLVGLCNCNFIVTLMEEDDRKIWLDVRAMSVLSELNGIKEISIGNTLQDTISWKLLNFFYLSFWF